ncbi:MAG: LysR substrate-binding domain-containing protein [Acidimicrobiales bacterium]|nr:LysR substrate-binding domain-containing protein [Acidimicrobiales bacterium]
MNDLPSIQGLNTFAIVARHPTFSGAADELEIGQSAVSHAIRQLERWFGCALFDRDHRGIRLTAEGRILADGVGAGLTRVHQAVRDVQNLHDHASETVTISVSTATASNWLIPKLARFKADYPEIDVRCVTTDSDRNFETDSVDLFVPVGRARWPGCRRWALTDETVYPVCSPAYAASVGETPWSLDVLLDATLLTLQERHRSRMRWSEWFMAVGAPAPDGTGLGISNDYSVLLHAAIEGQGVGLGWHHLVTELVRQGRLIRPVAESVTTAEPLWLNAPPGRILTSATEVLRDWLLAGS